MIRLVGWLVGPTSQMEQTYDAETTIVEEEEDEDCCQCHMHTDDGCKCNCHEEWDEENHPNHEKEKHPNHEKISNLKGQLEDFMVDRQERDENFIHRFQRLLSLPDWTRFKNPSCPITQMQHLLNEWKSYRDDEAETEQLILRKLSALE